MASHLTKRPLKLSITYTLILLSEIDGTKMGEDFDYLGSKTLIAGEDNCWLNKALRV